MKNPEIIHISMNLRTRNLAKKQSIIYNERKKYIYTHKSHNSVAPTKYSSQTSSKPGIIISLLLGVNHQQNYHFNTTKDIFNQKTEIALKLNWELVRETRRLHIVFGVSFCSVSFVETKSHHISPGCPQTQDLFESDPWITHLCHNIQKLAWITTNTNKCLSRTFTSIW